MENFLYNILLAAIIFSLSVKYVHMLQLESYQNNMYIKWLINNFKKSSVLLTTAINALLLAFAIPALYLMSNHRIYNLTFMIISVVFSAYLIYDYYKTPKKKPLVITNRVKRLFITVGIILLAIMITVSYFFSAYAYIYIALILLTPIVVLIASLINNPIERGIKGGYLKEAKQILEGRTDLIKIGITGSFGKTSTKFILHEILSVKYNTLCTPASYNTPMGITRVIRDMLKDENEVFIAEMGARYTHDIKDLCDLVKPKYGIISSIGKQHLDTFGSLDNIINTKYDLIRSLPEMGIGYLPNDNGICTELFKKKDGKNKKLFSLEETDKAQCFAKDISVSDMGSTFTLNVGGEEIEVTTCLLGMHNIQNILACCSLARQLKLTMEEIKMGIANIKPIEHRLQLINTPGGVTVIDDAFNANPQGTKKALEVLSYFKGEKIIVTPGLVELGKESNELNREFGEDIAKTCDVAVLVKSPYTKYIKEGLISSGFDSGAIVEYDNLNQVTNFIGAYCKPSDVVLFENDLPDNYL